MDRRTFVKLTGAIALGVAFGSIMAGCSSGSSAFSQDSDEGRVRTVTDMAGRQVTVPANIETVYSAGQPGVVLTYMLDPERLLGWCIQPSEDERRYLLPKYWSLPVLGLMQGSNDTANREEIISRAPDIVLLMTSLADEASVGSASADADTLCSRLEIPVVVLDYELDELGASFRFLGDLFGLSDRAEELATICDSTVAAAKGYAERIPADARVRVYYAQGSAGLQTAPKGSSHSQVIDLVGAENVVDLDEGENGRVNVDMEEVLMWNPEVVITSYSMGNDSKGGTANSLIEEGSEIWSEVDAVQQGRVFNTPAYPFNWQDMPPSVNRILGIDWLGNLLYPDIFEMDIRTVTADFFADFYHMTLSEEQIDELLFGAVEESADRGIG